MLEHENSFCHQKIIQLIFIYESKKIYECIYIYEMPHAVILRGQIV